jgi:uncharacterized protein
MPEKLELNLKDRLILYNQSRILAALYPEEADFYRRMGTVFHNGYEQLYGWYTDTFYQPMSREESAEVFDIMQMCDDVAYGIEQLKDKSGIEPLHGAWIGFDGNNESSYLGFASHLVEEERRFVRLSKTPWGDDMNSHMPTLDTYRRMLKVWRPIHARHVHPLTKADIQAILAERVHPKNR